MRKLRLLLLLLLLLTVLAAAGCSACGLPLFYHGIAIISLHVLSQYSSAR